MDDIAITYKHFHTQGNTVKQLIMLESQHGPLPGYATALSEVVDYLQKVRLEYKLYI